MRIIYIACTKILIVYFYFETPAVQDESSDHRLSYFIVKISIYVSTVYSQNHFYRWVRLPLNELRQHWRCYN